VAKLGFKVVTVIAAVLLSVIPVSFANDLQSALFRQTGFQLIQPFSSESFKLMIFSLSLLLDRFRRFKLLYQGCFRLSIL